MTLRPVTAPALRPSQADAPAAPPTASGATAPATVADAFVATGPTSTAALSGAGPVQAVAVGGAQLPPFSMTARPGDTYWGLAIRFKEFAPTIGLANGDPSMTNLHAGGQLQIPGWRAYTVHAGDTLGAIAAEFGTDLATLVKANQLANPDLILVGQRLAVPDAHSRVPDQEARGAASALGLGRLVSTEGAAGSIYFQFEKGVVRYSNVEGKISSVTVPDPRMGGTVELSGRVLETALYGLLGSFQGTEGAAGSVYYAFDRAAVQVSNVTQQVVGVRWPDGRFTLPDQDVY